MYNKRLKLIVDVEQCADSVERWLAGKRLLLIVDVEQCADSVERWMAGNTADC